VIPGEFSDGAQGELRDAIKWYENEQPGLGRRFLIEIRATVEKLLQDPASSPLVRKDVRRRRVLGFPYDLLFAVEADRVVIVAVAHHHRRGRFWWKRRR